MKTIPSAHIKLGHRIEVATRILNAVLENIFTVMSMKKKMNSIL